MEATINSGDTAWVLMSTVLVLLMTPALAFFYGGMVRKKNILSTLNLSFVMMALIGVQWMLFGYSLAFGADHGGLIGGFEFLGFINVGSTPSAYAPTIPHLAFAAYQMMFAVIAPAIMSGAFVERVRFKTYVIFSVLWATLVYTPVAHWVWAEGGFIRKLGALDFAGGSVVHITAGFSALAFALAIRKRRHFGRVSFEPHNLPFTVLGAGLLWVGWLGFNGGSALGANGLAVTAIVNSNTAAAASALVWMLLAWLENKPSVLGIVTGAVVGLVAITPAAGYVSPLAALVIGAVASTFSYYMIKVRHKLNLDESLDVMACHGTAGLWGAIATGLFASKAINPQAANGLFYGGINLFGQQVIGAVIVAVFAFVVTFALAKLLDVTIGLSVSEGAEEVGLDISEHGERAYA
jgi:Amt family ammonium transporter